MAKKKPKLKVTNGVKVWTYNKKKKKKKSKKTLKSKLVAVGFNDDEEEGDNMSETILKKAPVPIGQKVIELIKVSWASRRAIILTGKHGCGKSEIVKEAAKELGIDFICMDLSIMEPPDLVGMPMLDKEAGVTRYLPPASMPRIKYVGKGKAKKIDKKNEGLLCFEELNRCGQEMQAPCLQLLTERRLNDYIVPEGWSMIACVNPADDGDFNYQVNELDPALRSRFMEIEICAGKGEWLNWANDNDVDDAIIQVVSEHPDPFQDVPPRTWTYVSDILKAFVEYDGLDETILKDAILGYIPEEWAIGVTDALYNLGRYTSDDLKDDDDDDLIDPSLMTDKDKWGDIKNLVSKYTATHKKKIVKQKQSIKNANMQLVAVAFNDQYDSVDQAGTYKWCEHVLGKQRHLNNLNKLFKDVKPEGRKAFRDSLYVQVRDKFKIDTDPTGAIVKKIEVNKPDELREVLGGLTKPASKRGRKKTRW